MQNGRRSAQHLLAELRTSWSYLTTELRQSSWRDFGAFHWHDLASGRAVRAAFGVVTPLAIGVATGYVEYGSFAALGALPAGFVSFRGVTRSRVLAVVLAAVGMAISTFIGATAEASHPLLLIAVIFGWGYAAGLLAALGPTALVVSLYWPVALLIASALPLGPAAAGGRALLVLAGGIWQAILVAGSWAVVRGGSERAALGQSFAALARYAANIARGNTGPPPPATLAGRTALHDPNPLLRSAARTHMRDLNEEAERIRASLTALGVGRSGQPPGAAGRNLLSAAQAVLGAIAMALTGRPGQRAEPLVTARQELAKAAAESEVRWRWAGEALLAQLRAACEITDRLNEAEPVRGDRKRSSQPGLDRARIRDMMLTLRASIGTSSEAGRHALRLAVVTAVAEIIVRAIDLAHGYWGVLTIFIVLRPDYSSTLWRGLQRVAGTLVGVGLGVATAQLLRLGPGTLLVGIAVSLVAAYALYTVNYLLYAVFLTDFVVVLLALLGQPSESTALARLAATGIGTGLALIAYVFWPTWARSSASEKLARLFAVQGRYAAASLRAYTRPGEASSPELASLRLAVRRARTDADASADRLAGEPDQPPMTAELARSLMFSAHRISRATITLSALLAHRDARAGVSPAAADVPLQARLDELAANVAAATSMLASTLRQAADTGALPAAEVGGIPPLPPPRLGPAVVAGEAPSQAPAEVSSAEKTGLSGAADGLVDAINTAAQVLQAARTPTPG